MKKGNCTKYLLVLVLMFAFSVPSAAYTFNPGEWVIHDDVAEQEAAEEVMSRQEKVMKADGTYRTLANAPRYPFGGEQNTTAANWPVSMRKAMLLHMPQDVKDWFKTPAFDYTKHNPNEDVPGNVGYFSTQQEMIDWFEALPKDRMKYQLITGFPYFTGEGADDYELLKTFQLIFAVFSKPSVYTPEQVKALGKPVIWLHGSIHGRESSPGEALLQVAKEFAEGQHDDILDKVTVVMIPRFNVDGAYNAQRQTTGLAPVGHVGQNTSGLDMNRDFVGFEAPIVRAVRQLQIAYDPVVSFCGHEQGYGFESEYAQNVSGDMTSTGHYRAYDMVLCTTMTYNLNVDQRVRDLGFYLFEPATKKALEASKVGWNRYVGGSNFSDAMGGAIPQIRKDAEVVSSDSVTGPIAGQLRHTGSQSDFLLVPEEGIGINGTALGNQSLVFVHEASAVGGNNSVIRLDYLRRVYSQYLGIMEICRTAAANIDTVMTAINAARATEMARTEPLSFWGNPPQPIDVTKNVLEYKTWKKEDTVEVANSIALGTRPIKWVMAHFATRAQDAQVTRPVAYIFSKDYEEAAMRLYYTGAKLERLTEDTALEVEAYTVLETGASDQSLSNAGGRTAQLSTAIRSVSKTTKTVTFPKDSFVVRMDQLGASLAGLALEPRAIRNYGNYYLSRTPGSGNTDNERNNSQRIPDWYCNTFLPVEVGGEFPVYRYMKEMPETYPANMNVPMMLTMVAKVHSPTQDEVADITAKLELDSAPEYISKIELPVHSRTGDVSYKAREGIRESFMLPNGEVVYVDEYISQNKDVLIVAPYGLDGSVYLADSAGVLVKVVEGDEEEKPEEPGDSSGGCSAGYSLIILFALIPFMLRSKKK